MFVHDYVIVQRPFGELLALLPSILGSELAVMLHRAWANSPDATAAGTVLLGPQRYRVDGVVFPLLWDGDSVHGMPGLEADLELSPMDGSSCDLHLSGRCLVAESVLSPQSLRRSRREAVFAVRSLLNTMKDRLERSRFEFTTTPGPGLG